MSDYSKQLKQPPAKETERKALDYVSLVYGGVDKVDAFKEVFPERYARHEKKAIADRRGVRATMQYHIAIYEQGKYIKSLYSMGAEDYYIKFINKRTKLLDKLYDVAMDNEEDMKHRLVASKTFLSSIPEPKKEITHRVEVDLKNDFQSKLEARQKQLYSIANKESDILDAEIEE